MKRKLNQTFQKYLRKLLAQRLPRFRPVRDSGDSPLYAWRAGPTLTFFILFVVARQFDWFTVELAWSASGKYPFHLTLAQEIENLADSSRLRLCELWSAQNDELYWFGDPDNADKTFDRVMGRTPPNEGLNTQLVDIEPRVDEAVNKILEYAIPRFHEVARAKGIIVKD